MGIQRRPNHFLPAESVIQCPPCRTTIAADSAKRLGESLPGSRLAELGAALFRNASHPELLAHEAFNLFHQAECAQGIAVVARRRFKRPDILIYAGWDYVEARRRASTREGCEALKLGTFREREFELLVEPRADLESRLTVVAIEKLVHAAMDLEKLRREEKERASLWPLDELTADEQGVFMSAAMLDLLTTARRIAATDLPVLLTGETGTGKEVIARTIHRGSNRAAKPFVPFNCTTVPHDLLDSQLFGYRRGAFTGAQESFPGLIRAATGGTLFLDEIGDMALDVQPKLLRFLETGEIQPLGEATPVKVDVRVIAATNANLDRAVAEGRFREDLYYRLNVIRFRIPPLRERREEIPPLVYHFLRRFSDEFRKARVRLAEETMEYLLLYKWPGNVRQLENELRRLVALAEPDTVLTPAHLGADIRESRRTVPASQPVPTAREVLVRIDQTMTAAVETVERFMVERALELCQGRVTEAATMLGISRKGLFLKRRKWGLQDRGPSARGRALNDAPPLRTELQA